MSGVRYPLTSIARERIGLEGAQARHGLGPHFGVRGCLGGAHAPTLAQRCVGREQRPLITDSRSSPRDPLRTAGTCHRNPLFASSLLGGVSEQHALQ